LKRLVAFLICCGAAVAASQFSIYTTDSLRLMKGVYASILFTAGTGKPVTAPVSFSFNESGNIPPGMRFESYPCNKPGKSPCPALARADGIFLDGVPTVPGIYNFTITASDPQGNNVHQSFTVRVSNGK
jgi:hypothetical protein